MTRTRSATYPDRETARWATQQVVTARLRRPHHHSDLPVEVHRRVHEADRVRPRLGEFYPVPDVGLPESAIRDWLFVVPRTT